MIWYDCLYLTFSKKLTDCQLSLPHGTNKKCKRKTKNKLISLSSSVPLSLCWYCSDVSCVGLWLIVNLCWYHGCLLSVVWYCWVRYQECIRLVNNTGPAVIKDFLEGLCGIVGPRVPQRPSRKSLETAEPVLFTSCWADPWRNMRTVKWTHNSVVFWNWSELNTLAFHMSFEFY